MSAEGIQELIIENIEAEDEGEYVFAAGNLQCAANLYVEVAYIIPKCFQDTVITETQTANFECEVTKPNLETHWFRDGIEIDVSDDKYEVVIEGLSYGCKRSMKLKYRLVNATR